MGKSRFFFNFKIHNTQCAFYNLWGKGSVPLKVPKCYFNQEMSLNQAGVLVLQDFSDILTQQSIGHGLTVNQLMQVGENLASLHAWSLSNKGWLGKLKPMDKKLYEKFPEATKMMFDKIKKEMPDRIDSAKLDVVQEQSRTIDDMWYAVIVHEEFKMPPVLVHGDLWCGNMMFRKKTDKEGNVSISDELLAIFDWQVGLEQ